MQSRLLSGYVVGTHSKESLSLPAPSHTIYSLFLLSGSHTNSSHTHTHTSTSTTVLVNPCRIVEHMKDNLWSNWYQETSFLIALERAFGRAGWRMRLCVIGSDGEAVAGLKEYHFWQAGAVEDGIEYRKERCVVIGQHCGR